VVEGVEEVEGGVAVAVADVQPGEVDQRFQGVTGGLRGKGTGAQVGVGVTAAPAAGQVSQTAVGGKQRGLVANGGGGGQVAGVGGGPGEIADPGNRAVRGEQGGRGRGMSGKRRATAPAGSMVTAR